MTADPWTARLSEYVDGELPSGEREALERHLAECASCEATVAELRRVTLRAGALADREPGTDLWPGIAARIGAAVGAARPPQRTLRRRTLTFTVPQLAAAAGVLLVVGAGAMWMAGGWVPGSGAPSRPAAPISMGAAPGSQRFAGTDAYDAAVADLQRVLDANRSRLDSSTVRVIEESLGAIDRAIARAQAALAADPSDTYLNAHLAETMRRKLDFMRRAAALATAAS